MTLRGGTLLACFLALVCLTGTSAHAHVPRHHAHPQSDENGHPKGARLVQVIESIEFNGITVLHEDLLHSMQPVQEKLDVTRRGISVVVHFQFDDVLTHPMSKPPSLGRVSIVHNTTEEELLKMPLRYDRNTRSQLRGELQFDAETRRKLRKDCLMSTCMAQVVVTNRFFGRSTTIELGKLKFYTKKASGKTGIKLETYPRLAENASKSSAWQGFDVSTSTIFHVFLVIGAALMLLVGSEVWRTYQLTPAGEDDTVASRRWLHFSLSSVLIFFGLALSRVVGLVTVDEILYAAPASAVAAFVALLFAGGPADDGVDEGVDDAVDDADDETSDVGEASHETKKTL